MLQIYMHVLPGQTCRLLLSMHALASMHTLVVAMVITIGRAVR